ncbi:DMT family transporter [Defluviimonas sp. WL0002]|uniref:DMT family transporter n=1 Tax=Albidovulum marisflavi TaxID=2984159 RepID=A0ABT2ZD91_9RHOB|nr:DMT family transporter [Defluviimonas sp. WL0002]MCV2869108.1 DMT family transporter [Defluviimonas sp. WL0002]
MKRQDPDERSKDARTTGDRGTALSVRARLALGMIIFGSATPVSKIVAAAAPVFVGALFRVALGALVLAPFAIRKRKAMTELAGGDWFRIALISLFGMFGFTAAMLYGMQMVSGVVGAAVMSTTPAVTGLAAMIFLRESPTWRKFAALVLAVVGVLILHLGRTGEQGAGGNALLGIALVFTAVCCEAIYTLLGKRMSERSDPILVAWLAAILSIPIFLPFAVWQWDGPQFGLQGWLAILWYGAGTLALGSWLWYSGIARAEGSIAAGFMGLMPVSALVLSYVLLDEAFRWRDLIGFATVFAGVLLMSWEHARKASE